MVNRQVVDLHGKCKINIPYMDPMVDNHYYQSFSSTSKLEAKSGVTLKHLLLMVQKSCDHQLRLVVYHPIIYMVLHMPGG